MTLADLWERLVEFWDKLIHMPVEGWVKLLMPFIKVAAFFACFFSVLAVVTLLYGYVENWLEEKGLQEQEGEREEEDAPDYDVQDKD
jgi:hypothetical protein